METGPPVKVKVVPTHLGLLLEAVATGFVFTTTVVVAELVHPLPSVTTKV
jgi:hypothetical protein